MKKEIILGNRLPVEKSSRNLTAQGSCMSRSAWRVSLLLFLFLTLGCSFITLAQPIPPSLSTEVQISTGFSATYIDDVVVNCDMMLGENLSQQSLVEAVVYSKTPCPSCGGSSQSYIFVGDGVLGGTMGNNFTISLPPGSREPDVALSTFQSPAGSSTVENHLSVVFMIGTNVWYYDYQLIDLGLPSFTYSSTPTTINLSAVGDGNPHIDMFTDGSSLGVGSVTVPYMHNCAVTWAESGNLKASLINIQSTPGLATPLGVYALNCQMPDIAALTDVNSGDPEVCIVFSDVSLGSPVLTVQNLDLVTGVLTNSLCPTAFTSIFSPRIEAHSLYDGSTGAIKWEAVASVRLLGTNAQVYGFNSNVSSINLSSPFVSDNVVAPVVSAGIGNGLGAPWSGISLNNTYGIGYFPWLYTDLWYDYVDGITGAMASTTGATSFPTPSPSYYYQVNTLPVVYPLDVARNYAIGTISNYGWVDFAAYFNGTDIIERGSSTGSNIGFKASPLSTNTNSTMPTVSVSPIPTRRNLRLSDNFAYTISDLLGREMQSGYSLNKAINVEAIPKGTYVLRLFKDSGNCQTLKFIKE